MRTQENVRQMNAPIALFVYNRPEHTRRVLEKLRNNELANESILYVFCDGPRKDASDEELKKIQEVREIARSEKWCKEVIVRAEKANKGVNNSIIDGITEIVNSHSKIIVVEDDILTSKYFLRFMNDALNKYENEEKIMAVSGYWFPVNTDVMHPFFLCTGVGWGWGTWGSAWNKYIRDIEFLINEIDKNKLVRKFNREDSYDFFGLLKAHQKGLVSGWDVAWYACIFLSDGIALFPPRSFTINIGVDGSGTHFSNATSQFSHPPGYLEGIDKDGYHIKFPESIEPDEITGRKMNAYLKNSDRIGLLKRIGIKIREAVKKL